MSHRDPFQDLTEPEFLISTWRLGHVTPNLGYLAEGTKCRDHFLRHGMSNDDETWYVGRGQWVMHEGELFSQIQGEVKVSGIRKFTAV